MARIITTPAVPNQGVLVYNGVTLQIVRTEEFVCEPVKDWSGVDYCLNHIVIGVRAYVNPWATATATGNGPNAQQGQAQPGDRAGVTLQNLLDQLLMVPRKRLFYTIGNDVVVVSPQTKNLVCDANNGPKPISLRIIEVCGGKTVVIGFRIETWTGGNNGVAGVPFGNKPPANQGDPISNSIVLSNRWSAQSHVDDDWITTITIRGRMKLRTDLLHNLPNPPNDQPTPDIFRGACLPTPVPESFKRDDVTVLVKEDGSELEWTCTDRQKVLNLGANSPATRIEGVVTTGSDTGFKDAKDVLKAAATDLGAILNLNIGGVISGFVTDLINLVPSRKNAFHLRAYGPPGAVRKDLLNLLVNLVLDRFSPAGVTFAFGDFTKAGLVSMYATVSVEQMMVELRGEFFGGFDATLKPAVFDSTLNLSNDVQGGLVPGAQAMIGTKPDGSGQLNPNPPNANTSRGVYVGVILEQLLKGEFDAPESNQEAEQFLPDGVQDVDFV